MLSRLSVLSPLAGLALALSVPRSFENVNIVRSVELGGSLTLTSTVYQIKALNEVQEYTITLSKSEGEHTSWLSFKSKDLELQYEAGFDAEDDVYYYKVKLPETLKRNEHANIVVGSTLSHSATPWPASAAQKDPARLKFHTDMLLISPYETASQKTKIRSPTPSIIAYEDPEPISQFSRDSQSTKSGSTVSYGPFSSLPPSSSIKFQREHQRPVWVQFDADRVPITVVSLKRSAEISHWGANLNIQDDIHLQNSGPSLKGHFSRVEHQQSKYFSRAQATSLTSITLFLPPGIVNPYFYDDNGNVSTSRFRSAPSVPQSQSPFLHQELFAGQMGKKNLVGKFSVLELTPRYPVLGGWNYTFTLGYDAPLKDWAGYKKGKYVVGVPFLNTFKDVAVDDVELKIVLPEGAADVTVQTPFAVDSIAHSTHITYLDTVGRPAITLRKKNATDKHDGIVFVSYTVPTSAHFKKPLAVAAAMLGIFAFAFVARRVDLRIHTTAASAAGVASKKKQ